MPNDLVVDAFVEDRAHEVFVRAYVRRVAVAEGVKLDIKFRSAQGGHGRAMSELGIFQTAVKKGAIRAADLLIVAIDGNCTGYAAKRRQIKEQIAGDLWPHLAFACPDPHIERWLMADPISFAEVVGVEPQVESAKCERGRYKQQLTDAVKEGGHIPTLGGVEFANDLVSAMDLYRAGKNEPSLRLFHSDLRAVLRRT